MSWRGNILIYLLVYKETDAMLNNTIYSSMDVQRELIITVDSYGDIIEVSSNSLRILGFKDSDMTGKNVRSYTKSNMFNLEIESVKNCMLEVIDAKGTSRYFDAELHPLLDKDKTLKAIKMSLFDIEKYKSIEKKAEQFKRICESSKDIIYTVDLKPEFKFTYVNPAIEEIIGVTPAENLQNSLIPFELVHPDDLKYIVQKIEGTAYFLKPIQTRFRNVQGKYIWLEDFTVPIYDNNGELIGLEGICRNIQDRKELEERLEKLSYWDGLTEIFNKNYFLKELATLDSEKDVPVGIIVCDLDNLKETNDTYGHLSGDMLIQNAASILKETFIGDHIVSRTGGDEFVVLIKNYSITDALALYKNLVINIKQYNNKTNIPIMMSIGFSYSDTSVGVMQQVLTDADKKMYKQKQIRKQNNE
jgi:diguanylate cyclase (GGDEF)-like protein/PAS domain S-box-containing protein